MYMSIYMYIYIYIYIYMHAHARTHRSVTFCSGAGHVIMVDHTKKKTVLLGKEQSRAA